MIDAIVGAVIVVASTAGLVLAVDLGNTVMDQAGRHPLSQYEREMLRSAGLEESNNVKLLQADLDSFFR